MRKIYTLIAVTLLITSCSNIQKMVDRGEYDKAILYAAQKLHGKKNKKTKHVQALEEAFYKVNQRDLDRIAFLEAKGNPENYDRIFDSYAIIKDRQEKISPFIPLVSKDGYMADFQFVDVNDKMAEVAELSTAYHYNQALVLLEKAEAGDKLASRRAYDKLKQTEKYGLHYKDKDDLLEKAHFLGTTRVLLSLENDAPIFIHEDMEARILSMSLFDLNSFWVKYYSGHQDGVAMDVNATVKLKDLDIGPESERLEVHNYEKRVEDGFKYVKELKVVGQDSLGRDIKERVKVKKKKYKKVFATVHELQREKNAILHSTLTYIDMVDGAVLTIEPFRVCATFSDVGYDARGDHRALSGNHSGGSRSVDRFPSDYEMAMQASESMKHRVKKHLKTFVF